MQKFRFLTSLDTILFWSDIFSFNIMWICNNSKFDSYFSSYWLCNASDVNLLKFFNRLIQPNTIAYQTINSKSLLSKHLAISTMVYCKAQTEDYIRKYFFLYYILQIGIVVLVACVVIFTIGFYQFQYHLSGTSALGKS